MSWACRRRWGGGVTPCSQPQLCVLYSSWAIGLDPHYSYYTKARDQRPTACGLMFPLVWAGSSVFTFQLQDFMEPVLHTNSPTIVFYHPALQIPGFPYSTTSKSNKATHSTFKVVFNPRSVWGLAGTPPKALRMNKPSNLVPISGRQASRELSILAWLF